MWISLRFSFSFVKSKFAWSPVLLWSQEFITTALSQFNRFMVSQKYCTLSYSEMGKNNIFGTMFLWTFPCVHQYLFHLAIISLHIFMKWQIQITGVYKKRDYYFFLDFCLDIEQHLFLPSASQRPLSSVVSEHMLRW